MLSTIFSKKIKTKKNFEFPKNYALKLFQPRGWAKLSFQDGGGGLQLGRPGSHDVVLAKSPRLRLFVLRGRRRRKAAEQPKRRTRKFPDVVESPSDAGLEFGAL